jgi:hypothetical protein
MDSHYGIKNGKFYLFGVLPSSHDWIKIMQHYVPLNEDGIGVIPIGSLGEQEWFMRTYVPGITVVPGFCIEFVLNEGRILDYSLRLLFRGHLPPGQPAPH